MLHQAVMPSTSLPWGPALVRILRMARLEASLRAFVVHVEPAERLNRYSGEMLMVTIDDVLRFWFVESGPRDWFTKNDAFDARVRERLYPGLEAADRGALVSWQGTARGSLALCLLLDQVPRNLFRGTPEQFRRDPEARRLAVQSIDRGLDRDPGFQPTNRMFLYLPLEHSESLDDQRLSVCLFRDRVGDAEAIRYADRHFEIIERFGRFPHRNAALGRVTTDAEATFLNEPNSSF